MAFLQRGVPSSFFLPFLYVAENQLVSTFTFVQSETKLLKIN